MTDQQKKVQDLVKYAREGGMVRRYHTTRTIGHDTDGQHSFNAVSLLFILHPSPSPYLIKFMLWHDLAEQWVGDLPAPIKNRSPALRAAYEEAEAFLLRAHFDITEDNLTNIERQWVKAIDVVEAWLFCHDQAMLGNSNYVPIIARLNRYLATMSMPAEVREFVNNYECQALAAADGIDKAFEGDLP